MKTVLAALALTALTTAPLLAEVASPMPDAEIGKMLSDRIDRDEAGVGIALALIRDGVPFFVSHGTLAKDDPTPIDEHTLFEAGSISKVLTNVLLATLVIEGKIDLDAPLTDYLPPGTVLPQRDGVSITAFDLATHTAGFSSLPDAVLDQGADNPYSGYGADALMAWIAQYELPRAIGSEFEYSNIGTALLAQAIEHVSGVPYAQLLKDRVLEPLGMDASRLATAPGAIPGMARGYDAAGEPATNWDFDAFAPAGALVTSTSDLAKFIAAASGAVDTPLKPAFELLLQRTRPTGGPGEAIGLGWFALTGEDRDIAWHNGITAGYRSFAGFDRKSGNGVVVLANMFTRLGNDDIGLHLLDPSIPLQAPPEPLATVEIDQTLLPAYAGEYVVAPGVVITISHEGSQLFAQLTGQQRFKIFPASASRFFFKDVDAQITFGDPVDGAAASLMLHQNGNNTMAIRTQ